MPTSLLKTQYIGLLKYPFKLQGSLLLFMLFFLMHLVFLRSLYDTQPRQTI